MTTVRLALLAGSVLMLAGCDALADVTGYPDGSPSFPQPERTVPQIVPNEFLDEDVREERGEARAVMDLADIAPGMTVADIGAGEGYYTVRLAQRVGEEGRVLAQDIDRDALQRLGRRVERERLENISIKLGERDDPRLPSDSFDRIFLVHVYREVTEPYAFLWHMWPALTRDGDVIVVDIDRQNARHGIAPGQLFCEFQAVGYKLVEFVERPDLKSYFARFKRGKKRTPPAQIDTCGNV